MSRKWLFIIIFIMVFSPVFSQTAPESPDDRPISPPIDNEWYDYDMERYSQGDMIFTITLGVLFPVLFSGTGDMGLSLGGTGILSYDIFLTPNIFIGAELGGQFSFSRLGNPFYMIPFGARIGYNIAFSRIEIPITLMLGFAPQLFLSTNYFGPIVKPGVSFFWRFNSDWLFGLNTAWWLVPQWSNERDVYGNFLELTLSARYHF